MNYKLEDIIDIPLLQSLQDKLNLVYSFPSAIIDNKGNILTAVAWQDICTKFHRAHPQCEKECIKSTEEYLYLVNNGYMPLLPRYKNETLLLNMYCGNPDGLKAWWEVNIFDEWNDKYTLKINIDEILEKAKKGGNNY